MLSQRTLRNIALALVGLSIPIAIYATMTASTTANASPRDLQAMSHTDTQSEYSSSGHKITHLSDEQIETLAKDLSPEDRRIILNEGTEPPFCGNLLDNKLEGVYHCKLCKLPLFGSDSKFKSGTGWPSFFTPVDPAHVHTEVDTTLGMVREEITCTRCSAHLGHVFPDGPKPTGLRFCVNSASLEFFEDGDTLPMAALPTQTQSAYFAGGCFWGIEDRYAKLPGVLNVVSGFQGGDDSSTPSYREVCSGSTGHAESVQVDFDPSVVSYSDLLSWFFRIHDPTQGNRQGPDVGTQYRSAIYTTTDEQFQEAKAFIETQQKDGRWSKRPITTELRKDAKFYAAEEYHQDYYAKNGGTCAAPIYPED